MKRFLIFLLICWEGFIPRATAFPAVWQKPSPPPASGEFTSLIAHPLSPGKTILASERQVFEQTSEGWKTLWQSRGAQFEIQRILTFKEIPATVFILTRDGLFKGNLYLNEWEQVYRGKNTGEKSVSAFLVWPEDPDHWILGTEHGLFESDDAGKTWFPFLAWSDHPVSLLCAYQDRLFAGSQKNLYVSEDLDHFRRILSFGSEPALNEMPEETSNPEEEESTESASYLFTLIESENSDSLLWLATRKGVFESEDAGGHWQPLSQSGLRVTEIKRLAWAEKTGRLFAAATRGIYEYRFSKNRWEELFAGLDETSARDLAVVKDGEEKLAALTPSKFVFYPLLPDGITTPEDVQETHASLFKTLVRFEPTAREVQKAVIRYGDLGNGKIKRWQAASRMAALLPSLSFGKDFSRDNNIDIDRGGTSDKDQFINGPDDIGRGWDLDVGWDLGDFIWSSAQTSIDSREKLNAELRNDMLAEATRVYYERRRLQMEIVLTPAASEFEHLEKLLRMDELTALLDASTNGYLSRELEKMYDRHEELETVWDFKGPLPGQAEVARTLH